MISATVITLNEEENIKKAIDSLSFVDEIVVIDCGSTDRTVQIAENLGAKVYHKDFDNFANQKNYAVSKTTGDWILSLDADEEIAVDLAKEIKEAVKNNQFVGYLIPRKNIILGKEIEYSRWSPDSHIWLWKKNSGKWVGDVHEEVKILGKLGTLENSKIHNSHKTLSSFIAANNLYSTLEAKYAFKQKVKFSFWKMLTEPFFEFFLRFFIKRGFLDGKEGFILSFVMGVYKLAVWIKLWELEKRK